MTSSTSRLGKPLADAHFTYKQMGPVGYMICDHCGRGMKRHKAVKGEGDFAGWTRYICK